MSSESRRQIALENFDELFLECSQSDIRNMKDETLQLTDHFSKLKETNGKTKRGIQALMSDVEGMKSRLDSLIKRQTPITPDYEAYQMMRRISRSSASGRKLSASQMNGQSIPESVVISVKS